MSGADKKYAHCICIFTARDTAACCQRQHSNLHEVLTMIVQVAPASDVRTKHHGSVDPCSPGHHKQPRPSQVVWSIPK